MLYKNNPNKQKHLAIHQRDMALGDGVGELLNMAKPQENWEEI